MGSLGGFLGSLGLVFGTLALNLPIFIDFGSIFGLSRGAPTLDFARPYGTSATFLENHRFPLGLLLGLSRDPLGTLLGPSWDPLGALLGALGRSWGALGALLGASWRPC